MTTVFDHIDFAGHEQVLHCQDPATGLKAIIAIHNTNRGPALGGCRMWPYASESDALTDVLRLSRGMTYKSAMANLDLGGGKSVIIGDPRSDKTEALLRAFGRYLQGLGGRYIAAEDSGTTVADMKIIAEESEYVAGIADKITTDGATRSGDPSPATAQGVFLGIKAAVKQRLGRNDLDGLRFAIQGLGSVGYRLAVLLHENGARLWVTDLYDERIERAVDEFGARAVGSEDIFAADVDVFSPCALGGAINDRTLAQLRASIVAGAANNQLTEDRHGEELMKRGILYVPDYVINAGGIIDISLELISFDQDKLVRHLEGIADTCTEIFERAEHEQRPTGVVADQIAEERFKS